MRCCNLYLFIIFFSITNSSFGQSISERYKELGELYIIGLSSASFPHPDRMQGHTYMGEIFPAQTHYMDSSVAIFIPKNFKEKSTTNFVIYFHGWRNNIDSALSYFRLIEQFSQSKRNAIFIFPQGPKNAPDSHGGKLEEKNGLKKLIRDVHTFLSDSLKIRVKDIGDLILTGHSGAYRVIAYCLKYGGLTKNISDVFLFDALYAQTDIYLNWIKNSNGHFINIYTENGGTKRESEKLMTYLDSLNIAYVKFEENNIKISDLSSNRLIFIHTDLQHNQVVAQRNQLAYYLESSKLETINQKP